MTDALHDETSRGSRCDRVADPWLHFTIAPDEDPVASVMWVAVEGDGPLRDPIVADWPGDPGAASAAASRHAEQLLRQRQRGDTASVSAAGTVFPSPGQSFDSLTLSRAETRSVGESESGH